MGDDLSQFFAKKAAKSKDKKKKVKVSVDDVGQVLERKAKRQEERDHENEEEEKRTQDDPNFLEKRAEDSEWLEYKEKEIKFDELGIRDMNLTEQVEEPHDEEKSSTNEPPKTWNLAEPKERVEEEVVVPVVPMVQKVKAWVAPSRVAAVAAKATKSGVPPDITNEEMFPTFENAQMMEKLNKDMDKKRKNDGFTMVTSDREGANARAGRVVNTAPATGDRGGVWQRAANPAPNMSADRSALLSTVKQVTMSGAPNPVPPSQPAPLHARNPNAYVPPSRRRKEPGQ